MFDLLRVNDKACTITIQENKFVRDQREKQIMNTTND